MIKKRVKLLRFPVFVPKQALEFAEKQDIELNIQELTLSAIAGYFATFASTSAESRFPYKESHAIAKLITECEMPKNQLCPFCLISSLNESTKDVFTEGCSHCSRILNLGKDHTT